MADPNDPQPVWTRAGQQLHGKALLNKGVKFTRVGIGAGDASAGGGSLEDATACVDERLSAPLADIAIDDGQATVTYAWGNAGLEAGFFVREIVLYAEDPDTGDELAYVYIRFPEAGRWWIPNAGGVVISENLESVIVVVSGVAEGQVTAVIDSSLIYATRKYVDDALSGEGSGSDADLVDGLHAAEIIAQALNAAAPVGSTLIWNRLDDPGERYLEVDGAEFARADWPELMAVEAQCPFVIAGSDAAHFQLIDARGYGLRVLDGGRGVDPGRVLGSLQGDAIGVLNASNGSTASSIFVTSGYRPPFPATDSINGIAAGENFGDNGVSQSISRSQLNGKAAAETRMKNMAVRLFVRAA